MKATSLRDMSENWVMSSKKPVVTIWPEPEFVKCVEKKKTCMSYGAHREETHWKGNYQIISHREQTHQKGALPM